MSLDLSNKDYSVAIDHYLNGKWNEAKSAFELLLKKYPRDYFLPLLLGNTLYSLGRLDEAIDCYHDAIKLRPDFGNAFYKLGVCYYRCGRLEEGLEAFTKVLNLRDQSHAMASYFIGLINHLLGNDKAALEGFSSLRKISKDSLIANFYLAQLKMKERKYDEALDLLEELSKVTPNLAEVHYLLGTAQFRLHNNTAAIKSYRKTLELNPEDSRARSVLELLIDV
jgi:tetratricopeptide (TPR) repeat protein